ncbi:MAG: hypothetical protein IPK60_01045 [Sandaracinaceae bacterium]|nr:hypothetical protein [Sandaracinaceae bacterium]
MVRASLFLTNLILAGCLFGCQSIGVGDPCRPESVPTNGTMLPGFRDSEAYLETSSVQCRTRVCIVNRINGDPNVVCDGSSTQPANCVNAADIEARVYCTCRCDGPPGTAEFCECPEGFVCDPVIKSGGAGIQGSYCVRAGTETGGEG